MHCRSREVAANARDASGNAGTPGRERELRRVSQAIDRKRASIDRYLRAFESGKLPEEACGHRVSALQREIVALETERSRLEAEYDLAPGLPTEDLLGELRVALLRASEEKTVGKLKQVLACVVDTIVVEGRDHIQPYYFGDSSGSCGWSKDQIPLLIWANGCERVPRYLHTKAGGRGTWGGPALPPPLLAAGPGSRGAQSSPQPRTGPEGPGQGRRAA
jgi:hypothetical protein